MKWEMAVRVYVSSHQRKMTWPRNYSLITVATVTQLILVECKQISKD